MTGSEEFGSGEFAGSGSESDYDWPTPPTGVSYAQMLANSILDGTIDPVRGVLTGQVPVRTMPIALDGSQQSKAPLDGEFIDGEDGSG